MIKILRTDSSNNHFRTLTSLLDKELQGNYGKKQDYYVKYNKIEACNTVVIVYADHIPAGCGCFKKYDEESTEIKRMFVDSKLRGQGISKIILGELENWAKELGYKNTILETGNKQLEAIGLYKKSGYQLIENYGQYKGIETSICMKKKLE